MHIGFNRLGAVEGFTKSGNALIRVDQNPEQVCPFRHADGFEFRNFHEVSPPEAGSFRSGTAFEKSGDAGGQKRMHAFIEMPRHKC